MGSFWNSAGQIEATLRKEKGAMRETQSRILSKGATLSTYGHTNPIRRLYTPLISNWWLAIKSISNIPIFEDWKVRLIAAQTINHTFGRPSSQSRCRMFPEAPSHQASQYRSKGELHTYHFKNHQHFENLCWKIGGETKWTVYLVTEWGLIGWVFLYEKTQGDFLKNM